MTIDRSAIFVLVVSVAFGMLGCSSPPSNSANPPARSQAPASPPDTSLSPRAPVQVGAESPAAGQPIPCSQYPETGDVGPFRFTSAFTRPAAVDYRPPDIRSLGLKWAEIGRILLLEIVIDEQGKVQKVDVLKSVHPEFDRVSIAAIEAAKYQPATRDGRPVAVCMAFVVQPHP